MYEDGICPDAVVCVSVTHVHAVFEALDEATEATLAFLVHGGMLDLPEDKERI